MDEEETRFERLERKLSMATWLLRDAKLELAEIGKHKDVVGLINAKKREEI